jgi:phosphoglucosamine mutase
MAQPGGRTVKMDRKLFGTDGIRGVANVYPMTAEVAVRLGKAIAHHFRGSRAIEGAGKTRILIGKDTRRSCYMFESGLAAGIMSMGADVHFVGPLPTPGISFLTTGMRADAGIVISASHNHYRDNGIKIFGRDGFKLPDAEELQIESLVLGEDPIVCDADLIGRARRIDDATGRYIVFLKNTFPRHLTLDGLRIVIDCAHGAAYKVAPAVLRELGAEVFELGTSPDGYNINEDSGSLHPETVIRRVRETRADVGITLDGDADRVQMIDERGKVLDGDRLIAICAINLKEQGLLRNNTVVSTIMSNIGLEIGLRKNDIDLVRTSVGDRYVVEEMRSGGYNLGGEQSGHLVFLDHSTTGDGMLAALQVLGVMQRDQKPLSKLGLAMRSYPQVLLNVKVRGKPPLDGLDSFQTTLSSVQEKLGEKGRVVVRYSGTEAKARVMVEGPDERMILDLAKELASNLKEAIGA